METSRVLLINKLRHTIKFVKPIAVVVIEIQSVKMESVSKMSTEIVKQTRKLATILKTKAEITTHIGIIRKNIKLVESSIKEKDAFRNENLSKLENNLAILRCYLTKFKRMKNNFTKKVGAGIKASTSSGSNTDKCKLTWKTVESGFKNRLITGIISNIDVKDPLVFLQDAYNCFSRKIKVMLKKSMLKVNAYLACNFLHPTSLEIDLKTFATPNSIIDGGVNLKEWYKEKVLDKLTVKLSEFAGRNSGWALHEVLYFKVNINSYIPLNGGGFSTFVELPKFIATKHAVINVRNNDEYCFLWAIMAAIYPVAISTFQYSFKL
ncbi:uncharacterized protein LOC116174534 [Photinus pyralis]|uniref:uncharacterized protein LOC116164089 n=1 Tax=Photinus pyralis TaxID=7054 RepID=UPI001267300C|nr:uncharacterized protein LOC116164089 [Photinus pyralis]XP_031348329.1 uncharacterized protein LOC116174534 [Photinus pyralis]